MEKIFDDFRKAWLQLDAKGSTTNKETDFEPKAFHELAIIVNHPNQGPTHQIYNLFTETEQIFKSIEETVTGEKVADELKKLQDDILAFVKKATVVTITSDTWAPEANLEFSVGLSVTGPKQAAILDMDPSTFDVNSAEDFNKIKDIFFPVTLSAIDNNVNENQIKAMALHGLVILSGGTLDPTINPDSTETDPLKKKFTNQTSASYKVNAARLKKLEMAIRDKVADSPTIGAGAAYTEGSLLHKITEVVRVPGTITGASDYSGPGAFNQALAANLAALPAITDAKANILHNVVGLRTVFKIRNIENKWVMLVASEQNANTKNLVGWLTQAGADPRFIVTAPDVMTSAAMFNVPNNDHIFNHITGTGVASTPTMFAPSNVILSTPVVGSAQVNAHQIVNPSPSAKFVKFRLRAPHGLPQRANSVDLIPANAPMQLLIALRLFNKAFTTDILCTDPIRIFDELNKMSPAIAQLFAYNKFTAQVQTVNRNVLSLGVGDYGLPSMANSRHMYSTHVVDPSVLPNTDDISVLLTAKLTNGT